MKKRALFIAVAIVLMISGIGVVIHAEISKNQELPQQAEPELRVFDLNSQVVEKKESFSLEEFYSLVQWAQDIYNNYDKICFESDRYDGKYTIEIVPNHSLSKAVIQKNSEALSYPAYDDYLDAIGNIVYAQMRKIMPESAFTDDSDFVSNINLRWALLFTDISQSAYSSAKEMVRRCRHPYFNEAPADFDCGAFILFFNGSVIHYYDHKTGGSIRQVFPTEAQEATLASLKEAYYAHETDTTETTLPTEAQEATFGERE